MENKFVVSIIGKSNVGKSSLINYLSKNYISSESSKPQTTRINIYSEILINNNQFIFIDTPGISAKGNDLLTTTIKNSYLKSLEKIDLAIVLTDFRKNKDFEKNILNILRSANIKFSIVVNKIDLFKENKEEYKEFKIFIKDLFKDEIFFISLLEDKGVKKLFEDGIINKIDKTNSNKKKILLTKNNEIISIQELIRGVIINTTQKEIPYDTAVKLNDYKVLKKINKINASIYVEKENQKKILIGSG
ncbi:MAG: GTPase Era [Pseudomonadota bacterium]|nr:GTPase Era [Pseudomonadota bacterium]